MSILLADDDAQLATFLSKSLESEGYSVHTALDEGTVLSELQRQSYKLIILDLNFGQTDGLKLLQRLRSSGLETPIIVLSARNRITDRIESLNLGADDYVTKPFSFQELAARTSALLRRKTDPGLSVLRVADLELDPLTRKAHRGSREIKLSPKEFDLLQMLMRHAGETIGRNDMLHECWGHEAETDSNLVDVYVNYLRKKIDGPEEAKLIFTVRGSGYRLGPPAPELPEEARSGLSETTRDRQDSISENFGVAAFEDSAARSIVHSLAHDLAQPLTLVRCFLEALSLKSKTAAPQSTEVRSVEQQADRAIALTKGISALTRNIPQPEIAAIRLDRLLNEIFSDFIVLVQSGFVTVERRWNNTMSVTSNPALRQVIVLLLAKVIGRNPTPLVLTVSARQNEEDCEMVFSWRAMDNTASSIQTAGNVFGRDAELFQEMLQAAHGEFEIDENSPEVILRIRALTAPEKDLVH